MNSQWTAERYLQRRRLQSGVVKQLRKCNAGHTVSPFVPAAVDRASVTISRQTVAAAGVT